ncbi:protein-L-isoaspartate(D-aspartate) O-methyltransferase isoform X4 [Brachyhypopomus gauderio]|uniref:protein-L-isoaspartate(D-aspartate) O-methyltransferase isoform X4 n=1 Tax=Brachyhypopomus gauderio TaxID=698409 RepID=UPI0040421296
MSSDVSPPSPLDAVGVAKVLCACAALTAALYALHRLCVIMAWKSGGTSQAELVNNLRKNGIIKSDRVYEVMLATDRAHFSRCNPYMDSPQSIGYQATISAPHMHAYALELLHDQLYEGAKALDVGSGSGILSVCFARMVGPKGKVIGIDHIKELVDDSVNNVKKDDPTLISSGRINLLAAGPLCTQTASPPDWHHYGNLPFCSGMKLALKIAWSC